MVARGSSSTYSNVFSAKSLKYPSSVSSSSSNFRISARVITTGLDVYHYKTYSKTHSRLKGNTPTRYATPIIYGSLLRNQPNSIILSIDMNNRPLLKKDQTGNT